jgi:acetamidase/formamidase
VTLYQIEPDEQSLHGVFSRDLDPLLTIDSGDTVRFRTLDAAWNLEPRRSTKRNEPPTQFPRPAGHENGHALCGPVAIRGAEPGMTLAIRVDELVVGGWGFTAMGGRPHRINQRLGLEEEGTFLLWTLEAESLRGEDQHGHSLALRPFMGVMGMPPAEPGPHPTAPPRNTGGNLDCKELIEGSTLFLPIAVPGGLFSVGDGHARQGDGEVCITGIECPMERVELTFHLHPELKLTTPRAHTPAGWITFGVHEDLNEAALIALEEMVNFMSIYYGLSRHEALGLASLVVDMRITQIVNGTSGVHAVLSHEAIEELGLKQVA